MNHGDTLPANTNIVTAMATHPRRHFLKATITLIHFGHPGAPPHQLALVTTQMSVTLRTNCGNAKSCS